MPRVHSFKVRIETGAQGTAGLVQFNFNSHTMPFETITGSTESGAVFEGRFVVDSFCHSLTLVGPDSGTWDIDAMTVEFECDEMEPYSVHYGAVSLDEATEVNLWRPAPAPIFDV